MKDHTNFNIIVSDSTAMQQRLAERGAQIQQQLAGKGYDIDAADLLESDSFRIFVLSGQEPFGDPEAELIAALPHIKKAQEARALAEALADQDSSESVAEARRIAALKPHERMSAARELAKKAPPVVKVELTADQRAERLAEVARYPLSMRISKARELGVAE